MKKILLSVSALVLVAGSMFALVSEKNDSQCCNVEGAACCYVGSPCCAE